jgi:hypothetical protein
MCPYMNRKHEYDFTAYSRAVPMSHSLSSLGLRIRFSKRCPMSSQSVYTPDGTHHAIEPGRVGYISAIHEHCLDLTTKGRVVPILHVPFEFLEWIPQPEPKPEVFVAEGFPVPATPELIVEGADVRFVERCPVTNGGRATTLEESHHSILKGKVARVVKYRPGYVVCDLAVEGRSRVVCNVPLRCLELLNFGDIE